MGALCGDLNCRIEAVLTGLVQAPRHICLIDPPSHPNVGDCAILLGELDFLRRAHPDAKLSFVDVDSYSDRAVEQVARADVLLIHGGGNFGDIWPHHHQVRLWAIRSFPGRPIIQLPQSIHFSDEAALDETSRTIEAHPNFTLLVRDHRSFEFAQRHMPCPSLLVPDMAFAIAPITRKPAQYHCFCLLRTDKERVADHDAIERAIAATGRHVESADWLDQPATFAVRANRLAGKLVKRAPQLGHSFSAPLVALRRQYAERRLAVGIELLSRGRIVVADRLHAHIISCLLDIPNVLFDSLDGKISALYETWTYPASMAKVCRDLTQLPALLEEIDGVIA